MFENYRFNMNIRHTLAFLLLALFSITSSAQDYKANIRERFTQYSKHIITGEFDKSMDYIPEAMFTIIPRAQMVALFEQLLKNKEMEMKFIGFDIKEIADKRKIDTCYYAKVKYISGMTMKINSKATESADTKAKRLSMTKAAFANTFGSDNVKLDETTETYTITPTKNSWAISKNGQTDWKFLNVEPKQRLIMEKLLPKELIEESVN
jgi:hypothetical protein